MATMKEEELEALKKNVDRMLQEKEDVMENALIRQRKMLEKSHEEELECQKRGEQERLDAALRAAKNVFQQKIAEVCPGVVNSQPPACRCTPREFFNSRLFGLCMGRR